MLFRSVVEVTIVYRCVSTQPNDDDYPEIEFAWGPDLDRSIMYDASANSLAIPDPPLPRITRFGVALAANFTSNRYARYS